MRNLIFPVADSTHMQSMDSQRIGISFLNVTGLHPGYTRYGRFYARTISLLPGRTKSQERWRNLWDFVVFEILFKTGFVCKVCVCWDSMNFQFFSPHFWRWNVHNLNFIGKWDTKNILKRKFDFCNILYFADNRRGMNSQASLWYRAVWDIFLLL